MDQKTTEMIEKLAVKLGTTAERLWDAAAQYQYAEAWAYTFVAAVCAVTFVLALRWLKFEMKDARTQKQEDPPPGVILSSVLCVISSFVFIGMVFTAIPKFLAPAGAALHQILGK